MAILIDNTSGANSISTSPSGTLGYTVNVNTNGLLVVAIQNITSRAVTAISWGAQNFSGTNSVVQNGTAARVEIWWLIAPLNGTKTITITTGSSGTTILVTVLSLTGVNQVTPLDSSIITGNGSASPVTSTDVVVNNGSFIVDSSGVDTTPGTVTVGASQTQVTNAIWTTTHVGLCSYIQNVSSGNNTMTWTFSGSHTWQQVIAAFAPSATNKLPSTFNNYQFPSVLDNGNGVMSVSEKVR